MDDIESGQIVVKHKMSLLKKKKKKMSLLTISALYGKVWMKITNRDIKYVYKCGKQ